MGTRKYVRAVADLVSGPEQKRDWYVSSVHGSDSADGRTPDTAFATFTKLATVLAANETISLDRGSHWRESLDCSALSGVRVYDHGIGPKPCIDCSDDLAPTDWTPTPDQDGVYYATVTPDAYSARSLNTWADDVQLTPATTLANCQATAGSFWASSAADDAVGWSGGVAHVHVHPTDGTDPRTDGKTYAYSKRAWAYADKSDGLGSIDGVWLRRNLANDGAISALYGQAWNCLFTDGNKHQVLAHEGAGLWGCRFRQCGSYLDVAQRTCYPIVWFDPTGTGKPCTTVSCVVEGRYIGNAAIPVAYAYYAHTGDGTYQGPHRIIDCHFPHCNLIIGGSCGTSTLIENCDGDGVVQPEARDSITIKNSHFRQHDASRALLTFATCKYKIIDTVLRSAAGTIWGQAKTLEIVRGAIITDSNNVLVEVANAERTSIVGTTLLTSGASIGSLSGNVEFDGNTLPAPLGSISATVNGVTDTLANFQTSYGWETGHTREPFVVAKTADYPIVMPTDSNGTFTNTGAADTVTLTLPTAVPNLEYGAAVTVAEELRLDPNGTEVICLPSTGVPGAAGKYLVASAIGATIKFRCYTAGVWAVESYTGTWTAEG
jgi:hypothetical protein